MTPDELRAIIAFLRERVRLDAGKAGTPVTITFRGPAEDEMIGAGLDATGVKQILRAPWWEEMVADIVETPDFCEPDDSPQQVLAYARDVVTDTLRKRVILDNG